MEGELSLGQERREGWLIEFVDDQNPGLEALSRSKREGSEGDVRKEAMEKSKYVRGRIRGDHRNECFMPTGVGIIFQVLETLKTVEVS